MSIVIKNLSFVYNKKTAFEKQALNGINLTVDVGDSLGIIGSTGSGKSTLIQHINGLVKLQSGELQVFDIDLNAKKPNLKLLRQKVGMLFQYPEYQLFADTVEGDVTFGPMNFGQSKEEAEANARLAISMVGLNYDEVKDLSPLELSGGQKRRVAMAGILACRPEILVLDEPTAGLDPVGKKDMLDLIRSLKNTHVKSVITVSHNMDEIAEYCNRVILLHDGVLVADVTPAELFYNYDVESMGLTLPHAVKITKLLREKGYSIPDSLTEEDLTRNILDLLKREGKDA